MNPDYPQQPQVPPAPQPTPPNGGYPSSDPSQYQQQYAPQPQVQQPQAAFGSPAPTPPKKHRDPAKKWLILSFVFIFTTLVMGGLAIWALINYFDQRDTVDSQVTSAVALAKKEQQEVDAAAAAEAEKEPNRLFAGPDDYGRVAFEYPKTWSVYEANDASNGRDYEAYFHPAVIPSVSEEERYALRLTIQDEDYETVIDDYNDLVEEGELRSSSVEIGGENGTRLEGNFSEDIRGTAVILKIRDKTVTLRTDASTFIDDFNKLIATVTFNK